MANMHLANAHTHICSEKEWHESPMSFINIIAYCIPDLVSAGMSKDHVQNITVGAKSLHVSYGESIESKELWHFGYHRIK